MEHGGQYDGYDYSQNRYLRFEHADQEDNFVIDKTNLSVIKSYNIIVKWQNQQKPMI